MAQDASLSGKDYLTYFDARSYLRSRFSGDKDGRVVDTVQPLKFQIQCYHDFYSQHGPSLDPRSARLLEFGGGPSIYTTISAVPYVSEIVFADYVEGCRKEVNLWLQNDPSAHDWSPFFKHVTSLEGKEEIAAATRQEELRKRTSSVIPCNIFNDPPIDHQNGDFNVISTVYCLESAITSSVVDYEGALKKLGHLLKDGGYIASLVALEASWYGIQGSEEKFKHLYLTSEDVHSAFRNAGFSIEMVRHFVQPKSTEHNVGKRIFIVGRKTDA